MTEAERRMLEDLTKRTGRLEHFAFGNGKPGADERLRNIEATQTSQSATLQRVESGVQSLVDQENARSNQWLGAKRTIIGAAIVISILTGGSALWLSEQIANVTRVLP